MQTECGSEDRKFVTTETVVLGFILGLVLTVVAYKAHEQGEPLITDPVRETFFVAVFLTALVSYCAFPLPTFFAKSRPRLAAFLLPLFCGHISLLFDSFAVVLLLVNLQFAPWTLHKGNKHHFNVFAVKTICALNALTVGGALYIGELWGLPHYIASDLDQVTTGLPLLVVLTPFSILTSLLAAYKYPVRVVAVDLNGTFLRSGAVFISGLVLLIVTHDVLLCIGFLLLWTAICGRTVRLVKRFLHELHEGAFVAIGLILVAMLVQEIPEVNAWFKTSLHGYRILILSAISSPFAGASIPPAENIDEFFRNLSWLMCGAPLFVSSSLVAIIVFKDTIDYEDLPSWMRRFASKKEGFMQEALAYTLLVVPLTALLGLMLAIANYLGVFGALYRMMH